MKYNVYTTSKAWKDEIRCLLKEILKQRNDFQFGVTLGLSRDEIIGCGNSSGLGEFLKHIVQFFGDIGDKTIQEFGRSAKFKHRGEEAKIATFHILEEKLSLLDHHLRDLILAFWAYRLVETTEEQTRFMNSLQDYCWDELNQLSVSWDEKKPASSAKKRVKVLV